MTYKILLVEDEIDFKETLVDLLSDQGYEVVAFETVSAFEQWYRSDKFDLAILDRTLPDGDGIQILHRVRESTAAPVLILSGLGQVNDKIMGFDADADHYLVKPIDLCELLSIIKQLLRKCSPNPMGSQGWRLDLNAWILHSPCGFKIELTHRESLVLQSFIQKSGDLIERDGIVKLLGFDPDVYDMRRLESLISRLRKKIESSTKEVFNLQTVYGKGYALHHVLSLWDNQRP